MCSCAGWKQVATPAGAHFRCRETLLVAQKTLRGEDSLSFLNPFCYHVEEPCKSAKISHRRRQLRPLSPKKHHSRARTSLLAKRPGSNARLDPIFVFILPSNSKTEQIFACLNSDHSAGMAKQDFFRFRIESRHDNVDLYFDVYRWTVTGYDKHAP